MHLSKWQRRAVIVFGCAFGFYALTMPFRYFFTLSAVTEVRPASALPPVFGLLWGPWGALGAALGNLAADIQSGYAPGLVTVGFCLQFFYGFLPWVLWHRLPPGQRRTGDFPRMDSTAHILKYLGIDLLNALGMALSLGLTVELFDIGRLRSMATSAIFLNNLVFTVILGIPLLTLAALHRDRHLSLNARVALFCVMQGVVGAVLVGLSSYYGARHRGTSILMMWNQVFFSSFAAFLLLFGGSILFLRYMERKVTVPAEELARAAEQYLTESGREPDHGAFLAICQPHCKLRSEMGVLARSSRKMVLDLRSYMQNLEQVTADRERINTELSVAARIQTGMLPREFPDRKAFRLRASMEPAKEVGGDFYDFFSVDEDHLALVIADVSGKGVPAALFMVIARTLLHNSAQTGMSPGRVLEQVNRQLCENNEAEMFVTVWLGILELSTGTMTCANAGHEYPAVARAGEPFQLLRDRHGFVLAGMLNTRYREYQISLSPGDRIYVYTDGVTEAADGENRLYGTQRMLDALNRHPGAEPGQLLRDVRENIRSFVGQAPQFDDITMLGLTYYGDGGRT